MTFAVSGVEQPTAYMSTTSRGPSLIAWTTWKLSVSSAITRRAGIVNNLSPRESRDAVKSRTSGLGREMGETEVE